MGAAENAVTKAVRAACVLRGAMVVRVQAGGFPVGGHWVQGAKGGSADLIGCYCGKALALEVKVPKIGKRAKTKQNDKQIAWEHDWVGAGGRYFVVRSASDTLEALDSIDKEIA